MVYNGVELPEHLRHRYPNGVVGHTADGLLPPPMAPLHSLYTYRGEIMQAAQRRDIMRLKLLVSTVIHHHKNVIDVSQLNSCLMLHHVIWTGELNDLSEFLLSIGCDPFYLDINGDSVFHYAIRGCNFKGLKMLHGMYGLPAFEVLNNNHFNLMLTAAAEAPDEKAYDILNILEFLYLRGCSIESQDVHGKTALFWACQRGSLTLVQWLLARGANLAHRDHVGRSILQAACVSGDEEVVRQICEKGAIRLLECESNDDRSSNTALKLCWNGGNFFLGLSLRQWYFQYKLFGRMSLFRNTYAWYYWLLSSSNLILFGFIASRLTNDDFNWWYQCMSFFGCFVFTQLFWTVGFASDPGHVKTNIIPDQSARCSTILRYDLAQKSVFSFRVTSASYKLQLLERENCRINSELITLNRHVSGLPRSSAISNEQKFDECVARIHDVRSEMLRLMDAVAEERKAACPSNYARHVFDGNSKKVCLTCRIVKHFRAHHCGDCAHCVHRFDHHCIWLDNCIGVGNQRSFLGFLFMLTFVIGYLWFLVGSYFRLLIAQDVDILLQPLFYIALLNSIFNLLWAGFVGYLLGRTIKAMCTNMTFYEFLKKPSHIQKRFQGRVYGWFWDLSDLTISRLFRNIYVFMTLSTKWDYTDYPGNSEFTDQIRSSPSHHPSSNSYSRLTVVES